MQGIHGVTRIAEGLHANIERLAPPLGKVGERRSGGIAGFVYGAVRGGSTLAGQGLDAALKAAEALLPADSAADEGPRTRALVSALNGVLGDHLARTNNPLAIPMTHVVRGEPRPRLLVLVHGLCMNDLQWTREGHDHGVTLAQMLDATPVYLRYNSGRHVSENGAQLAALLEELVVNWPVPVQGIILVGHSMGGLVSRSAAHHAQASGMAWPARLRQLVFLGTPHHGAALERGGNWLHALLDTSPYLAPFTRLAALRSDGITDLRHGNLLASDWQAGRHLHRDARTPVPLPDGVACFAVAGTLGRGGEDARLGDGLVSVQSALGEHAESSQRLHFPPDHRYVATGVGHLDLLCDPGVTGQLKAWLR